MIDVGKFKNKVIGSYTLDVSFIYFKNDHTIQHQWITLTNVKSKE